MSKKHLYKYFYSKFESLEIQKSIKINIIIKPFILSLILGLLPAIVSIILIIIIDFFIPDIINQLLDNEVFELLLGFYMLIIMFLSLEYSMMKDYLTTKFGIIPYLGIRSNGLIYKNELYDWSRIKIDKSYFENHVNNIDEKVTYAFGGSVSSLYSNTLEIMIDDNEIKIDDLSSKEYEYFILGILYCYFYKTHGIKFSVF